MPIRSLAELNEQNRLFWNDQGVRFQERMGCDAIREMALDRLRYEQVRGIPLRCQTTIEEALEAADDARARFRRELARKGGQAKKGDALQSLIEELVCRKTGISAQQLEAELRRLQGLGIIDDIDEETIWFTDKGDRLKGAKISGLKDRLSRAKAKLKSR